MSLLQHAKKELELAGYYKKDSVYGGMIPEAVLELMEVFANQGHSGGSAPIVINIFKTLALFKNLSPITGEDSEWVEIDKNINGGKTLFQNNRCFSIFKESKDGIAYYNDAIVWRTPAGATWSGIALLGNRKISTRMDVKFPFTPKTFVIDVDEVEDPKDNWTFFIKNVDQFNEVIEYYK